MLVLHFIIEFNLEVTDNLQNKIIYSFIHEKHSIYFLFWLVCQMKLNSENGTVIKQLKLYTANEQTVNMDIVNRKRVYELGNSDFP